MTSLPPHFPFFLILEFLVCVPLRRVGRFYEIKFWTVVYDYSWRKHAAMKIIMIILVFVGVSKRHITEHPSAANIT